MLERIQPRENIYCDGRLMELLIIEIQEKSN